MSVVIYHNPRCSKSRQTLTLLEENSIKPQIKEYLKQPPTAQELKQVLKLLGIKAHELLRKKEPEYKSLGCSPAMSEEQLIDIMVANPKLIERPIVISGGKAAIGRPPEAVLEIL